MAQTVKNAMQETWVRSLGQENPLEKGMATHSSILAGEFHRQRSLKQKPINSFVFYFLTYYDDGG